MEDDVREMSPEELRALCTNLSKSCAKQMLEEEAALFSKLAQYYGEQSHQREGGSLEALSALIEQDLSQGYPQANKAIQVEGDRGALRALVWGEKASKFLKSLLLRYDKQGDKLVENTGVFVCDICGFVYMGEKPPEVCPVCKVPSFKILPVRKEAI